MALGGFTMSVKLTGVQDLLDTLAKLKATVARKLLRRAVAAASKPLLKAIKQGVPVKSGLLKKSEGRKVKTYRQSGVVVAIVGPRTGYKQQIGTRVRGKNVGKAIYANPVKYAHLVERGTKHAAPARTMQKAIDSLRGQMLEILRAQLQSGIEAELTKG